MRRSRRWLIARRWPVAAWRPTPTSSRCSFPKENSSNGCVATVDVIYPAAPQFLLMGPTYAKALVAPALIYSTSPRWKFPFAPHDVGVYPQANGQVYGGGESSTNEADMMPVEESGNLILLCAAIAKMEGNASFAALWWPQLTRWEAYLERYGRDPENQLCTDDFMGHLAHNANLSVKAILAIAAYGELCRMRGDAAAGAKYRSQAREYARHWMEVAADGDHYRIAFDKPNTWSQKYNLIWDKLLGLDVFPPEVARSEVAYYKKMIQRYGVPLDSRTRLTKTDWCLWSATLADDRRDFEAIVSPIFDYLNETTARLPFVDSYFTDNPRSDGMRARPVIGGVFIKMLEDPATWKKWASRDQAKLGTFRPAAVAAANHRSHPDFAAPSGHLAFHVRETGRRLGDSRASTTPLEGRPRRLRHRGNSGRRDRHDLEYSGHLAAPRDHHSRGRRSKPPSASRLSRRRRRDLPGRRARGERDRLRHELSARRNRRSRAGKAQARREGRARRSLPSDRRRTRRSTSA